MSKAPRVTKQVLELTAAAAVRIRELLSKRDKPFLRLGVRRRGCSGMSYTLSYAGASGARFRAFGELERRTHALAPSPPPPLS